MAFSPIAAILLVQSRKLTKPAFWLVTAKMLNYYHVFLIQIWQVFQSKPQLSYFVWIRLELLKSEYIESFQKNNQLCTVADLNPLRPSTFSFRNIKKIQQSQKYILICQPSREKFLDPHLMEHFQMSIASPIPATLPYFIYLNSPDGEK